MTPFEMTMHGWAASLTCYTNRGDLTSFHRSLERANEALGIRKVLRDLGLGRVVVGAAVFDLDGERHNWWGDQESTNNDPVFVNDGPAVTCSNCGRKIKRRQRYREIEGKQVCLFCHPISRSYGAVDIPTDSDAYKRGVEASDESRRLAIRELPEFIANGRIGHAQEQMAKFYLAKLTEIEEQNVRE